MKEITELDNKYFVLKLDDIKKHLSKKQRQLLFKWELDIEKSRAKEGKKRNSYVILNLDDEIAELYLEDAIDKVHKAHFEDSRDNHRPFIKVKVKDIAVALVNAILKAKERNSVCCEGCENE